MPFKHNAARRHRTPKARYRVQNWPVYEAGLKWRGDLTLWLDEAAVAGWQAPRRSTPGGQAWYSDAAIELVLMLRLVFHLALRQAKGFAASVLRLLGQTLRVPDHTTLSRRSRSFAGRQPKVVPHGPMHPLIDGTGLKLFGQGEWDEEKHGRRSLAETAVGRYKGIIGPKLRARLLPAQQGEVAVAAEVLNRMIRVSKPISIRVA
jgi:Transposase DDE domain